MIDVRTSAAIVLLLLAGKMHLAPACHGRSYRVRASSLRCGRASEVASKTRFLPNGQA